MGKEKLSQLRRAAGEADPLLLGQQFVDDGLGEALVLVFHRGGPAQTSTIAKEELWGTHCNFAQYFFVKSWEMKVGAKGIF